MPQGTADVIDGESQTSRPAKPMLLRALPAGLAVAAALALMPTDAQALDLDDPQGCTPCHATVVAEWQGSQHARAHHTADPIYGALRSLRAKVQGPQVVNACAKCHTPRAAAADEETLAAHAGVSCASCHAVAAVSSQGMGRDRFTAAPPGTLFGALRAVGQPGPAPHGLGPPAEHLRDGQTLCLACHEQLNNPQGVSSCATGIEYGGPGGGFPQQTCVDCHMPALATRSGAIDRDGQHRSHAFVGALSRHRAALAAAEAGGAGGAGEGSAGAPAEPEVALVSPVTLALALEPPSASGESRGLPPSLVLSLGNQSGHRWPTGFPGRLAQVVLVGHDAVGAAVWTPPPAPLGRGFADAEGQPTLAAFAVRQTHDTRLTAGETRTLRWPLPAEVQSVEATVKLWLVAPPAAQKLGLTGTPEAKPRVVAREVWRR